MRGFNKTAGAAALFVAALTCASNAVRAQATATGEQTFHITPVRPVAELRREALAAKPPEEKGDFRPADLVELVQVVPDLKLEIRYATSNNFLGTPVYEQARAFMQRPAAEALARVASALKPRGYGLVVFDAYRPWYVTKIFWDATPQDKKQFVADPAEGSKHNRGCAVDLTLYDLKTGQAVSMPSGYDEMSERAYADYKGGTDAERQHRETLRRAMEAEGFAVYAYEWWHYDYKDWQHYRIGNTPFDRLGRGVAALIRLRRKVHPPDTTNAPAASHGGVARLARPAGRPRAAPASASCCAPSSSLVASARKGDQRSRRVSARLQSGGRQSCRTTLGQIADLPNTIRKSAHISE
jgi:D-alanyl-D-alanine dipeptidase